MRNKLNVILAPLFALIFASIFYRWFFQSEIIGGDWPYLFKENLKEFAFIVPSWNAWYANGMGGTSPFFSLQTFNNFTISLAYFFNISWVVVYKIFWFGLFIFLSIASSIYFVNSILPKLNIWQKLTASVIFSTNTYILMLVSGGQMGVALSYAITPLVLARFTKLIDYLAVSYKNFQFSICSSRFGEAGNFQLALLAGLVLAIQVLFDPRIAYISMIAVAIYMIFNLKKNILNTFSPLKALAKWGYLILYVFVIPGLIAVLLHAAWILPILISKQNFLSGLGSAHISVGIVKFLSFASFSQSFSLLHSNWPENIFGKVGFMKPEFLMIPVIAFSSLFFIRKINDSRNKIIYFCVLGLLGAFLGKGANPPFGGIYLWLFENIPGFVMFRDPTKFYLLVALAYSVLIPFSIYSTYKWLSVKFQPSPRLRLASKIQNYPLIILLLFFVGYWAFLIRPAIFGQLGGTFKNHDVPKEYVELKDFLYKQPEFFRTLWIPRQQRFTFVSNVHPSVEAIPLLNVTSSEEAIQKLRKEGSASLADLSIKYVIVPYDSMGEIFQKDRKYDEKTYGDTVKSLSSIEWLKPVDGFGKIKMFEIPSSKKHFYLEGYGKISSKMISPTHYLVNVSINESQNLIFSEKYNSYWAAKVSGKIINSKRTSMGLNSFPLKEGNYDFEIIFLQEKLYDYGRILSLSSFLIVLILILRLKKKSSNLLN